GGAPYGTVRNTTSPNAIAWSTVPACANGPMPATRSFKSSGWRDENRTLWPSLIHNPPIVPPIWPAPTVPIGILPPLLVWARNSAGPQAAPRKSAPPPASIVRRLREWCGAIECPHECSRRKYRRYAADVHEHALHGRYAWRAAGS